MELLNIPDKMDQETIKMQIEETETIYNELLDWFSDFSTRVTVTVRYVVCGIFAMAWIYILKENYSGFPFLLISLLLAFTYMLLDIVRFYLIARKARTLYKQLYEISDFESIVEEKDHIRIQLQRMHNKSWKCLNFQLIIFCLMIVLMGTFFMLNL